MARAPPRRPSRCCAPELADVYDAFETPRAEPRRPAVPRARREAREYLAAVRERARRRRRATAASGDGLSVELVLRHELQHSETMLQTLELARLDALRAGAAAGPRAAAGGPTGLELVDVPGRAVRRSAPRPSGFAYDNERPRHGVELPAFRIGRTPITNATFLRFVEGGGYQRREWWSDEGWAWKEEYDITRPLRLGRRTAASGASAGWEPLRPRPARRPRLLVRGRRLRPRARRSPPHRGRVGEGGDLGPASGTSPAPPVGRRAARAPPTPTSTSSRFGTGAVGRATRPAPRRAAARACSATSGSGRPADFRGYPGFGAFPYREYSEVFFGADYKVLRGGSWATRRARGHPDLPQLGLPAAPPDLLRLADRQDAMTPTRRSRMQPVTDAPPTSGSTPTSSDGAPAHAGRRRARRPDAPVQGAAAQALLRRPRLGAVRPRSASCPSTTRRAPSGRSSRRAPTRSSAATGAAELVELGSGSAAKTRAAARRDGATPGRCERYVPFDVSEAVVRDVAPRRSSTSTRACASTASSATSSATSTGVPAGRRARGSSRSSAARSATSRPGSRRRFLRAIARAARPRRPPAARHRPRQGPGDASRPPTTTAPA